VSGNPRIAIVAAFLVSFLAVVLANWQGAQPQTSLPGGLWGPALFVVAGAAALLRFIGGSRFWPGTLAMAASVPAAFAVRIAVDMASRPAIHPQWPIEIGIAACIGFLVAVLGALGGRIIGFFVPRRERAGSSFDMTAVGDRWHEHPLVHDGVAGTLRVRELGDARVRVALPLVALAQVDAVAPGALAGLTTRIQAALEQRGNLLVLVHRAGDRVHWYAYGASRDAIDAAFRSLGDPAVHWGINDDPDWVEYDHARSLVGG
jgi:hypothetical protein